MTSPLAAVVLAGGAARRLGGLDKPTMQVRGRSLLATAVAACVEATEVVVVGPQRADAPAGVRWTREDPPGGGPVAALGAGLAALQTAPRFVVVLAADLPAVDATVVAALRETAEADPDSDGAIAIDAEGRRQPLLAVYRRDALQHTLDTAGILEGAALHRSLRGLRLVEQRADQASVDIDTPEDLRRWTQQPSAAPTSAPTTPPARAGSPDPAPREDTTMDDWITHVCRELDIPRAEVDVEAILDLARDAAHSIERPAAPVTTYLLGYAAGRASADPSLPVDPNQVARWFEEIAEQARARADES